jgi:hypothetical protein
MSKTYLKSLAQGGVLLIACFAIVQTVPITFQSVDAAELPQTDKGWAEFAQREWLRQVLDSLQRHVGGDHDLLSVLKQVRLWTLTEPLFDMGPNAIATYEESGKPIIYLAAF